MQNGKELWREGVFACELREIIEPPHVVVTKDGEDVVEFVARSALEIEERAAALRDFIVAHRPPR